VGYEKKEESIVFSSTFLWVGLGILVLVVIVVAVVLYNTPQAKAARARMAEEYRRQEEERKEKERAKAERKERQMENFRKQCLVVYIREKDGRKSSFEAVLIRKLLGFGITVEPLPENDGRAVAGGDTAPLKDGRLALVGTSWHKNGTGVSYERGTMWEWEATYCDYRLLAAGKHGKGEILGAGCDHENTPDESFLAVRIIGNLVSTLPVESE